MKVVHKNQTNMHQNGMFCAVIEYPIGDSDINGAIIELHGRYPDKGRVVNMKCKELAYVIKGTGKLVVQDNEIILQEGDLALIEPGEKYYWEGNMTLFVPSTPAWYPQQHREVN